VPGPARSVPKSLVCLTALPVGPVAVSRWVQLVPNEFKLEPVLTEMRPGACGFRAGPRRRRPCSSSLLSVTTVHRSGTSSAGPSHRHATPASHERQHSSVAEPFATRPGRSPPLVPLGVSATPSRTRCRSAAFGPKYPAMVDHGPPYKKLVAPVRSPISAMVPDRRSPRLRIWPSDSTPLHPCVIGFFATSCPPLRTRDPTLEPNHLRPYGDVSISGSQPRARWRFSRFGKIAQSFP